MPIEQIPRQNSARPTVPPEAVNRRIAPETLFRVVRFNAAAEDELARARTAWVRYRSTRPRDAIYCYLTAVFEIVLRWRRQGRTKACLRRALAAAKHHGKIRTQEPFANLILCTSDVRAVDAKTRSKWSRALRYAEQFKPDAQSLTQFLKSMGGINECAGRWSFEKRESK